MKNHLFFYLLLGMLLHIPHVGYSQCASIYEKAIGYMEKGNYNTAIKYFRNAKVCDEALSAKCDAKIKECQRLIRPKVKKDDELIEPKSVLTLEKNKLEFGAESTSAQIIKVESSTDWQCSSNAEWCTPLNLDNKRLSVSCEINREVNKRTAVLDIINGNESMQILVTQEGLDSKIEIKTDLVEFNHKGDILEINLECNTHYEIADKPEWVNVVSMDSTKMIVKVEATKKERMGVLSIYTPDGKTASVIIKQNQKKLLGIF